MDQWSNEAAIGYLKYALKDFNRREQEDSPYKYCPVVRHLTDEEVNAIIGSMYYAFDMMTVEQARRYN